MTMQGIHIQGMFFVYERHIKYKHTRFRYNATENIQPMLRQFVCYLVKVLINKNLRELHRNIKLIKITNFRKKCLFLNKG